MTRVASPFIESLIQYMTMRRYSPGTIESYFYWIKHYTHFHDNNFKPAYRSGFQPAMRSMTCSSRFAPASSSCGAVYSATL
jgi:hypothetical protein